MTFWDDAHGRAVGWRYSLAASFIPALFFLAALPFMYESYVPMAEGYKPDHLVPSLSGSRMSMC